MALILTETDTVGTGITTPSPFITVNTVYIRIATNGGPAGSTITSVSIAASNAGNTTADISYISKSGEPGTTLWQSGNWVVRLDITTANTNLTWNGLGICSTTSNTSVVSATGLAISCGTTGVKSATKAGNQITPLSTERIQASLGFSNGSSMVQSFSVRPDQNIDTPLVIRLSRNPAINLNDPAFV
jgi:hypothetical protein